ncbi:MAG: RAMP superfamily CRISPR-associated protein [bacterium]
MSGYAFTPLPDAPRVVARAEARFDRRVEGTIGGRVRLVYRLDEPVHVGAGHKLVEDGQPVRATVHSGEVAVVPGSSLKGAIRARYEAITRSCAGQAPRPQRDIVSRSFGGFRVELAATKQAKDHSVFTGCRTRPGDAAPALCPACALFGVMNRKARAGFGDFDADAAATVQAMPAQYSPRLHHVGEFTADRQAERLTVTRLHGRKFHGGRGPAPSGAAMRIEVIPAGAAVAGDVRLTNVTAAELGGLLVALGFARGSLVKIGAGKNLGFGRLWPTKIDFALIDHRGRALPPDPAQWDTAWDASPDRWAPGEAHLLAMHRRQDV